MKDIKNYFSEALEFKLGEKVYTVNESLSAYLGFEAAQKKMKDGEEIKMVKCLFEHAFGKKNAEELMKKDLPLKVYMKMTQDIVKAWSGQDNTPSIK